jgi:hypothetical protein
LVVATVSDGSLSAQRAFTWTVQPANGTPTLNNPGTQTATVGQAISLQLQASDPNGDRLLYAVVGVPPGLVLNSSTGRVTGTPLAAGSFTVTASVSDGLLSMQQVFTWTVIGPNLAPALVNPGNQTSNAGDLIALQLVGSDLNRDPLRYSAIGLPPGVQISGNTGLIAGTASTPGTYAVMVSVNDGSLTTSRTFSWNVVVPGPSSMAIAADQRSLDTRTYTGATAVTRSTGEPVTTRTETGLTALARTPTATAPTTSVMTGTVAMTRSVASDSTVRGSGATVAMHHPSTAPSTTSTLSTSTTHSVASEESDATLQALSRDSDGLVSGGQLATSTTESSAATPTGPSVTIQTPVDHASFAAGSIIHFMAVAKDAAGRDLSSRIAWSSSLDGTIGTGASFTKVLSTGTHTITATVTDSRGRKSRMQIVVTVE